MVCVASCALWIKYVCKCIQVSRYHLCHRSAPNRDSYNRLSTRWKVLQFNLDLNNYNKYWFLNIMITLFCNLLQYFIFTVVSGLFAYHFIYLFCFRCCVYFRIKRSCNYRLSVTCFRIVSRAFSSVVAFHNRSASILI